MSLIPEDSSPGGEEEEESQAMMASSPTSAGPPPPPLFDLDTYIGRYKAGSETRIQRLVFIVQRCTSSTNDLPLKHAALEMLERQLKESNNVVRYNEIFAPANTSNHVITAASPSAMTTTTTTTTTTNGGGSTYSSLSYDADWVRTATATNEANLEVLEARLSAAQANLNKDAIRTCYINLADYYAQRGHLREALRHVLKARDYCTNRTQTSHICWKVIELAMDTSNYNQVRDYVTKAEHSIVAIGTAGSGAAAAAAVADSNATATDFGIKLKVAAGLALLGEGKYKEAAIKFRQVRVPPETMGTLASPEDVALYSSLLALATLDRCQLVQYLEEQPTVLELVPVVRDAIRHYVRAEYRQCLALCTTSLGLELDLHLSSHADTLVEMIRNRSLVNYLQPYRRVHLPHMATMFGDTTDHLLQTLADLIGKGHIRHARIDCQTQTLQRDTAEMKEHARLVQTQKRIQQLEESVMNDAYASMVRLACLEHDTSATSSRSEAATRTAASYFAANPEDVFAEGAGDSDEDDGDDDVDMVYDVSANPEDALQ